MCVLPTCMTVYHMHAHGDQYKNPLEVELQIVVNYHVGAGNQAWVL